MVSIECIGEQSLEWIGLIRVFYNAKACLTVYLWIPFMLEFCLCSLSNSASYVQWIANEKYLYASSLPSGGLLVKAFFMKFSCKMLRLNEHV